MIFVYLVYGFVPELMPHFAFRREKHFKTANKKIIKCPHCCKTFITVDEGERVELYRSPKKGGAKYDCSMKCRSCRKEVGIAYASA